MRRGLSGALLLLAAALPAQVITEFSAGLTASSQPEGITAGPDGNLWFTEGFGNRIGRITPRGAITEFSAGISPGASPWSITAGPDGNVWFGEQGAGRVGRITPTGVITEFSSGISAGGILGITTGPDGNVWFTEYGGNAIGKITPAGVVTEFPIGGAPTAPQGIAAGPDGNVWFTEYINPGRIGRITPAGVITEFETGIMAGGGIEAIAAGPDGNMWFTDQNNSLIGRITTSGVVTEFAPGGFPQARGIAGGPDGNVWFTEYNGAKIGRIDPSGTITEFNNGMSINPKPRGITLGPDGNLWFTEETGNRIGRMTTGVGVVVSSISPPSGPASGIAGAVLGGDKFAAGATVTVGGVAASGVVVNGVTQITVDVPALAPGGVYPVAVTVPGPATGTLANGWFADFTDVPGGAPFHAFVEKLVRNSITAGCGGGNYCPGDPATRAQMAVFLLRSNDGRTYTPPACAAPAFGDVPCSSGFAIWVNELAARGVTAGCGGGNYCPNTAVTRGQMAVFLLRTREGPLYTPPACVSPTFSDVPCSSGFAIWVNELAARGITAGCGGGNYCPGDPVTRGQMAVFLSTTFALP